MYAREVKRTRKCPSEIKGKGRNTRRGTDDGQRGLCVCALVVEQFEINKKPTAGGRRGGGGGGGAPGTSGPPPGKEGKKKNPKQKGGGGRTGGGGGGGGLLARDGPPPVRQGRQKDLRPNERARSQAMRKPER